MSEGAARRGARFTTMGGVVDPRGRDLALYDDPPLPVAVGDGALGFWAAIREVFPDTPPAHFTLLRAGIEVARPRST